MQKVILLLGAMLGFSLMTHAQVNLKGKVVNKESGTPISGVNIYLEGTTKGTATNAQGAYTLRKVTPGDYQLVVSHSGFKRIKKAVTVQNSDLELHFQMEKAIHGLGEVVITATGTPHHLKNTPIQTEVIRGEAIEKSDAGTLQEALTSLSPSFSFDPTIMGSYMSINGLSNKYLLILIDGNRVAGDISGNTDLSRLNMDNVERIEVVKGASSSLYGSEAMGAVINIITKKPIHTVDVNSFSRISKDGEFTNSENLLLNFGKVTSSTSFTHKKTDGYQLSNKELDDDELVDTEKMVVNESKDNSIQQKLTWALNDKLEINGRGSWYNKDLYRPESEYKYGFLYEDITYGFGAKYLLPGKDYLKVDYHSDSYQYSKVYNQDYKRIEKGEEVLSKKQMFNAIKAQGLFHLSKTNTLLTGFEMNTNHLETAQLPHPEAAKTGKKEATDYNFMAQDEWKIFPSMTAVLSARYNYHEAYGSMVTPKVALMYKLGDFRLRGNYARGYKIPTLQELHYDYFSRGTKSIGNPDLDPQKSHYYGLSAEYNKKNFSASVTGYYNDLTNMIYKKKQDLTDEDIAEKVKKKYIYENMGEAHTKGVDFLLNAHLGAGWYAQAGYSYIDAKGRENKEDKEEKLERISNHAATCRLGWDREFNKYTLNINLNGRYESEKFFTDGNADPYQLWDLTTNHTFTPKGPFEIKLAAGVRNIFDYVDDKPYGSNYGTLDPGRRIFVSLNLRFVK